MGICKAQSQKQGSHQSRTSRHMPEIQFEITSEVSPTQPHVQAEQVQLNSTKECQSTFHTISPPCTVHQVMMILKIMPCE